jgi:ATP-binding cassette subfamily B protein
MSQAFLWSPDRLGEALAQVARQSGLLKSIPVTLPAMPTGETPPSYADLGTWAQEIAAQLAIETEAVYATYDEVTALVQGVGPALLWLPPHQGTRKQGNKETLSADFSLSPPPLVSLSGTEGGLLVLLKGGWRGVALLKPDLGVQWVAVATVRAWLCQASEAAHQATLGPLLDRLALQDKARAQTQQALLQQHLGNQRVASGWIVRLSPGAPFWQQIRQAQIQRPLLQLLGSYLAQLGITALTWWLIGGNALRGHFAWVWLWAWALLLFTAIPFRLFTERAQQALSETFSVLSKQRLLYGILRRQPEQIRHQGAGQFFGQVMEADGLDNLALGGGLIAGLALLQAGMALVLLRLAAPLWILPALLLGWLLIMAGLLWLYLVRQRAWVTSYRSMSSDLVERMVGHRTRLAQEPRDQWHDMEDQILAHYTDLSTQLDQVKSWLTGSVTRGWMVLALAGLAFTFWWAPMTKVNLPLTVAGILLALQALTSITNGIISLANAVNVWDQVRPLFAAAQQASKGVGERGSGEVGDAPLLPYSPTPLLPSNPQVGQPLLLARGVEFRYQDGGRAIVRESNLQIRQGDRLLLEGPSGGGKSTLAALLAGLRTPNAGLLLLHGHDRQTLGATAWRRRVMLTPQFHENHIFNGSLAFNLLMGQRWPPQPEDLRTATALCVALGLGALIERMPAGLQQMVGESGWRLSHGERSRVYIARTLLQQAELMILDESFAALDPETMRTTLACVLQYASTLLVIAHP